MSQNSPFNPPPHDANEPPAQTPAIENVTGNASLPAPGGTPGGTPAETMAPAYLPGAPAPSAHVETVVPEPARAHSATNPLLAMLVGALLSCAMIGGGIVVGRGTLGAASVLPSGGAGTANNPEEGPLVSAVKRVGPAVMNVDTTFGAPEKKKKKDDNFLPAPGSDGGGSGPPEGGQGKGTGFIIDSKNGYMLTNAHVVAGAKKVQVTTPDGRKINGKVRGYDRESDIAVVIVDDKNLPEAKLATFKNPKDLDIGQWTLAIGNPYGQENTVTVGVLSAVGRTLPVPPKAGRDSFELTDMMQTDTPINPGNSGGPLCNARGEVIGINTAILPGTQGLGFTIPISKAMSKANEIIKNGKVLHPWIGIQVRPIYDDLKSDLGLPDKDGGFVTNIEPNSPAAKAGLQQNDVVRAINGKTTKKNEEVIAAIKNAKVRDKLKFEVLRTGKEKKTIEVTVGDRPPL